MSGFFEDLAKEKEEEKMSKSSVPYKSGNFFENISEENNQIKKNSSQQLLEDIKSPEKNPYKQGFGQAVRAGASGVLGGVGSLIQLPGQFSDWLLDKTGVRPMEEAEKFKLLPDIPYFEELFDKFTDKKYQPKSAEERVLQSIIQGAATAPFSLPSAIAGGAAGGVGQGLEEAGAPGWAQMLASFLTSQLGGIKAGKVNPKLNPKQQQLQETAKKHNLRNFQGLQMEEPPSKPIVSAEKQAKVKGELDASSKKAINEVIKQEIPIKKLKESGIDLEEAYKKVYQEADQMASKVKTPVNINPILKHINQKITEIKKSAPSLSKPDKVRLGILQEEFTQLTKSPQQKKIGPSPLKLGKKLADRVPKIPTAEQMVDQAKNYNENVKGIYKKPEFSGSEEAVRQTYGDLHEQTINAIEKVDAKLGENLRFGNRIFSENAKLNRVENLLSEAFKEGYNPKKLSQILNKKANRQFVQRDLGKDAVKDLNDIAHYGNKAQENVLSKLKNPTTAKDFINELTPWKAAILLGKHVGFPLVGTGYSAAQAISNRIQGALFVKNGTRQKYVKFVKEAASGNPAAFIRASKELSKAVEDEYGSEAEFFKQVKKSSQE